MTPDEKMLGHRYHADVIEQGNLDLADKLFAGDCITHSRYLPRDWQQGNGGVKAYGSMLRTAFPDVKVAEEDVVTSEDLQGIRWTFTGTHNGTFLGIPPTGRKVTVSGYSLFRIEAGQIRELWLEQDMLGLLQQLGAIPPAGPPAH